MHIEEAVVGAVLAGILILLTWVVGTAFSNSGAPWIEVALLCAAIILAGAAFAGIVRLVPKTLGIAAIIAMVAALGVLAVMHYHLISVCGDNICSPGECGSCAADCAPAACLDGKCQAPLERCDNSYDCGCSQGQACVPGRNTSDERGCAQVSCGDGFCDLSESAESCCRDCACQDGFSCVKNACVFVPPKVRFSAYSLTNNISVTSLAGNPLLTNSSGSPRPLLGLRISSTGYAKNTTVAFSIPDVITNTVPVGFIRPGQEVPVLWYVSPDPRLLTVTQDRHTNVTISIRYLDAQNDPHTSTWQVPMTLLGRGTLDRYGHLVIFVTDGVSTQAKTPDGIWDELRAKVTPTASSAQVQFPYETLAKGKGSARDIALLLASAYDAAGLRPSLVEGYSGFTPDPQRVYVRVRWNDGYVMLDPQRFNESFEQAIVTQPGSAFYDIRAVRAELNLTVLSLNKSFIPGADVTASTQLDQWCAGGARAVALHTITNNGLVPASVCAVSTISGSSRDVKRECFALKPHASAELRHGWQGSVCEHVSADIRIEPAQ